MNKMKKFLAAVIAITAIMSLAGCGEKSSDKNDKTEDTKPRETAVNMNDIDLEVSDSEIETAIAIEPETEPVTEANPYEYLDIINADYESCYNTSKHDACIVDGIAYHLLHRCELHYKVCQHTC